MVKLDLQSLTVDRLLSLLDQIDEVLLAKVHAERRELEVRLQRLERLAPGSAKRGPRKGSKVAPKYRNPLNPTETWTGRGKQPRWLVAALRTGKKLTDFAIAEVGAMTKKRGRKAKR